MRRNDTFRSIEENETLARGLSILRPCNPDPRINAELMDRLKFVGAWHPNIRLRRITGGGKQEIAARILTSDQIGFNAGLIGHITLGAAVRALEQIPGGADDCTLTIQSVVMDQAPTGRGYFLSANLSPESLALLKTERRAVQQTLERFSPGEQFHWKNMFTGVNLGFLSYRQAEEDWGEINYTLRELFADPMDLTLGGMLAITPSPPPNSDKSLA